MPPKKLSEKQKATKAQKDAHVITEAARKAVEDASEAAVKEAQEEAEEAEEAAGMRSLSLILQNGQMASARGPVSESTLRRMNISEDDMAALNAGRRYTYSQQDIAALNADRRDTYANLPETEKAELLGNRQAAALMRADELSLQEEIDLREAARMRKAESIAREKPEHRTDRVEELRERSQAYRDIQAQSSQDNITANQTAVYLEFLMEQKCRMKYSIDDGPCTELLCRRIANAALALFFHRFAEDFTNTLGNFSAKDMYLENLS